MSTVEVVVKRGKKEAKTLGIIMEDLQNLGSKWDCFCSRGWDGGRGKGVPHGDDYVVHGI